MKTAAGASACGGSVLMIAGVFLWSRPAALVLAGVLLWVLSYLVSRLR